MQSEFELLEHDPKKTAINYQSPKFFLQSRSNLGKIRTVNEMCVFYAIIQLLCGLVSVSHYVG